MKNAKPLEINDNRIIKINNKSIRYTTDSTVHDLPAISSKIGKLQLKSYQALDRIAKLSDEFKAGYTYQLRKSISEESIDITKDAFALELRVKFYKAIESSGKACNYLKKDDINTSVIKALSTSALRDLSDLKRYANQNVDKANSLFEKALYDIANTSTKEARLLLDKSSESREWKSDISNTISKENIKMQI